MPRPPLSPDERRVARARVVDAALDLLLDGGLSAVSLRRIGEAVGLSHTGALRLFRDKGALMTELRRQCTLRLGAWLEAHDPIDQPGAVRLHTLAGALLEWGAAHPTEYRLIFSLEQPALSREPALLAARGAVFDRMAVVVEAHLTEAGDPRDPRTVAHLAWATAHGLLTLHAAGQLVHGRPLDQLFEPALASILGTAPPSRGRAADAVDP